VDQLLFNALSRWDAAEIDGACVWVALALSSAKVDALTISGFDGESFPAVFCFLPFWGLNQVLLRF
jgi:hypothetical protein